MFLNYNSKNQISTESHITIFCDHIIKKFEYCLYVLFTNWIFQSYDNNKKMLWHTKWKTKTLIKFKNKNSFKLVWSYYYT